MDFERDIPPQVNWEDVPRWYGLSYRPGKNGELPTLIFNIRKESAAPLKQVLEHPRFIESYEPMGLLFLEIDASRGFGFERAMVCEGEFGGYYRLAMKLDPRAGALFYVLNYILLLNALGISVIDVRAGGDPKRVQLMEIWATYIADAQGFRGAPMGGLTSPALRRWMEKRHAKKLGLRKVEEAMRQVYNLFHAHNAKKWNALDAYDSREFGADFQKVEHAFSIRFFTAIMERNGAFLLCTIGNACDVSTDNWWSVQEDTGII
ncbi:MAG: hypothetical protein KGH79_03025 [Patescibacteria group bacterium]|nr:hypothetical protein [Patescibacteria group bacterium]